MNQALLSLGAACICVGCGTGPQPLFADSWESTYVTVNRSCDPSTHPSPARFTVALSSQAAADAYQDGAKDFKAGDVIVKSLYGSESDCSGSASAWTVMRKRTDGPAASGDDWEWQAVHKKDGYQVTPYLPDSEAGAGDKKSSFCSGCHTPGGAEASARCSQWVCIRAN